MRRSYLGKLLLLLSAGVASLASNAVAQDIQVVTYTNTVWTYNDSSTADNNPNLDPTHAWRFPGFVPTIGAGVNEWKTGGKGLFGNDTSAVYNEPSDPFRGGILGFATPLDRNINGTAARVTFYFITKFDWPHSPAGVILRGTNYLDDGAIVYLNGVEVFRSRIGTAGTEQTWGDLAANPPTEGVPEPLEYNATSLVQGENVLAVELHQSGAGSSDVAFATALRAVIPFAPTISTPNEPADRSVVQNRSTTFAVTGDGSPRPTYQWYKDNAIIDGATNASYTIARMQSSDVGLYKVILNNEFGTLASREANVTYVADETKPTIVRVVGGAGNTNVVIEYDEIMDPDTAADLFSFTVNGAGPTTFVLNPDGKNAVMSFDIPFEDNELLTLHAEGAQDLAENTMDAVDIQFRAWTTAQNSGVLFETYTTEGGSLTAITALTGHPNFPNNPRETFLLHSFSTREVYSDDSHENYGGRMTALFIPPTSGNWVFYISADDASQLYLNPTGPGANGKILVQEDLACCGLFSAHATAAYPLVAGQAYFLQALYKEGGGGDNCHVWAGPEGVAPPITANASIAPGETIPGTMLGVAGAPANVAGTFTITQQPADQNAVPFAAVRFTVGTSTDVPLSYQWMRDGVDIAGAIGPVYNLVASIGDTGARFSVRISILAGITITSAEALLTVAPDTTRPTVVSATTDIAGTNIIVTFSEPVGANGAVAANYSINGQAPSSATATSATVITLALASPLQDCVRNALVVSGVLDTAANVLNPNPTTVHFTKPQVLVGNTDTQIWRYEDTGADLGTAWKESAFDDGGWLSGAGALAKEDASTMPAGWLIRTELPNFVGARVTMYFRTHFNLASAPGTVTRLQLNTVIDDGAIYWLNGKPLYRLRVPTDPATYASLADGAPSEAPHPIETADVSAANLQYGDNVLAVEVHQSGTTSSDVLMGAELLATISACVPPLTITRSGNNAVLTWPDASFTLEKSADLNGGWTPQPGATGVSVPAAGNLFFRLVKP